MTLQQAHNIAEEVHDEIENDFPKVKHIMVHVNPEKQNVEGSLEQKVQRNVNE